MLKLNMMGLICRLDSLPEQEFCTLLFGTGYLAEHVALPFLFGEDISLRDIDWGAFSPEDARGMYYRCEEAESCNTPVLMLYTPAVSARPAAVWDVRFV